MRVAEVGKTGGVYTELLYGLDGGKLAVMNGQTLGRGLVGLPGGLTAVYTPGGLAEFRHPDWLGSARLTTTSASAYRGSQAYGAYGETYAAAGTADPSYTGHDPDTVGDLYDTWFRRYSSRQGRWLSPDPAGTAAVDIANPQSWNQYADVNNDPLGAVDPLGLSDGGIRIIVWVRDRFLISDSSGGGSGGVGGCVNGIQVRTGAKCAYSDNGDRPSGNSSGGFFSGLKDKFLDFLARNADYLPGVCTAGAFGFGTVGGGNANGGAEFGGLVDKQLGKPATVQPLGEVSYGPVGIGGTPSEALVFVQPAPKVPVGFVFAANPQNGFINNSGISIGFFAGKFGHGKGLAGGAGGGAYLTFSSAANCVKNF